MSQTPPADVLATHQRVLGLIPTASAECKGLNLSRDLDILFEDVESALDTALSYYKDSNTNFGLFSKRDEDWLLDLIDKARCFKASGQQNGCAAEEPMDPEDFYACCAQSQHCSQEEPLFLSPPRSHFPVQACYHHPPPPTHYIPVQALPLKNKTKKNTATLPRKTRRDKGKCHSFQVVHVELEGSGAFDVRTNNQGCINIIDIISGLGKGSSATVSRDLAALRATCGQWLQQKSSKYTASKGGRASTMLTTTAWQELMSEVQTRAPNPSWEAMAHTWSRLGGAVMQQLQQALA